MKRSWTRALAIGAAAILCGCSSPTDPLDSDVLRARTAWLANRPAQYSFEVAFVTSMTPRTGFYHVRVANGRVVSATDSSGKAVSTFATTIDVIWDRIIRALSDGEVNSVQFNRLGVPVESDTGPWSVDGGVHHSVRNFTPHN